jgi:hypothetical protein
MLKNNKYIVIKVNIINLNFIIVINDIEKVNILLIILLKELIIVIFVLIEVCAKVVKKEEVLIFVN